MQRNRTVFFLGLSALLVALSCTLAGNAAAQTPAIAKPAPLPVDAFFQNPEFMSPQLSPDGRSLGMLIAAKDGKVRLAVMDLLTGKPAIVGSFADADVGNFHWVNDNRLVYDVADRQTAQGDTYSGPGLFAVDKDGSAYRRLVPRGRSMIGEHKVGAADLPWNTFYFDGVGARDGDEIFVAHPNYTLTGEPDSVDLQRLNTHTGRAVTEPRQGKTRAWLADRQGVARVTTTIAGDIETIQYRESANAPWQQIAEFNRFTGNGFTPKFFAPDGTLYVQSRGNRDKSALYTFDFAKKQRSTEPVISLADYDFSGDFVYNKTGMLGVVYESDAQATVWFDGELKKIQKIVDDKLPGTINRLSVPTRSETPFLLVKCFSDRQPALYFLFNNETSALTLLGGAQTGIDPARMARLDMVRYKARDGLEIPAWLTLPNAGLKVNLPMVVLVHGGPYIRGGTWSWNADAQFLASRGYAVLEPEFRGSEGFGWKHARAGWKQWGLAMQDDIADGTKWAIAQHIADPKRICIAGASYGGYATLMGLIKDPDLYRCGIDWVGVTDISLMRSINWSDSSEEWKQYGMRRLVGDPDTDAAQFKATSPLLRAAEIRQPLLMAYGGSDRRVPISHGTQFYNAVKGTNANVEWIEYPEEGHGWYLVKNRVDFWTRVEKFLDQNIGTSLR